MKERTIYVITIAHYDCTHLIVAFPTRELAETEIPKIEADKDRVRGPIEIEEVMLCEPE